MLSDGTYAFINLFAGIASRCGMIPVCWCSKRNIIIPSAAAKKRTTYNAILIIIWCLFSIFQITRFYIAKNYNKFNITLMYSFGAFLSFEAFSVYVFQSAACLDLGNALFVYLRHINSEFVKII